MSDTRDLPPIRMFSICRRSAKTGQVEDVCLQAHSVSVEDGVLAFQEYKHVTLNGETGVVSYTTHMFNNWLECEEVAMQGLPTSARLN